MNITAGILWLILRALQCFRSIECGVIEHFPVEMRKWVLAGVLGLGFVRKSRSSCRIRYMEFEINEVSCKTLRSFFC